MKSYENLSEKELKHLVLDMELDCIKNSFLENNQKGYYYTKFDLETVSNQISYWMEFSILYNNLDYITNLPKHGFEIKFLDEFDTWVVVFGEEREFAVIQNIQKLKEKHSTEIQKKSKTSFIEDYERIPGNLPLYFIRNDTLLLKKYKIEDFYDLFRNTGLVTSEGAYRLAVLAEEEVKKIIANKEMELQLD